MNKDIKLSYHIHIICWQSIKIKKCVEVSYILRMHVKQLTSLIIIQNKNIFLFLLRKNNLTGLFSFQSSTYTASKHVCIHIYKSIHKGVSSTGCPEPIMVFSLWWRNASYTEVIVQDLFPAVWESAHITPTLHLTKWHFYYFDNMTSQIDTKN